MEPQGDEPEDREQEQASEPQDAVENSDTLKYHLLGPSLTKAGQDAVDQQKVSSSGDLIHCSWKLKSEKGF